jgi:hypothetical protein
MPRTRPLILCAVLTLLSGCTSRYMTPGGPAPLSTLGLSGPDKNAATDPQIRPVLAKSPLATFPATLAIARVQQSGYRNHRVSSYGHGAYSLVTARDIETDADFERLRRLPMIQSAQMVSRLILPERLDSDLELRRAAAALGADILVLYTFDTQYKNDDWAPPLAFITLGIFPTEKTKVTTDATAVLMDVRNGFIYGAVEATSRSSRINNFWTDREAADSARREAEREAFDDLLASFEKTWGNVVMQQTYRTQPQPAVVVEEDLTRLFPAASNAPQGPTYRTR